MLLTIQDQSKQSWQVNVDLKTSAWQAAGSSTPAGSPLALFPKGRVVREADGSLRLVTALWDLLLVNAPRQEGDLTTSTAVIPYDPALDGQDVECLVVDQSEAFNDVSVWFHVEVQ